MNQMTEWKAGRIEPGQKIKYRKSCREAIDDLVFLSRAISVIPCDGYTEFVFLKADYETFISVKYHNDGSVEVGTWENKDNPYTYIFRDEYGQLQALIKENKEK